VKLDGTEKKERFKLKGLDIPTIESTFGVSYKEFRDSDGDVVAVGGFEPGQTYTLHPKPVPPPQAPAQQESPPDSLLLELLVAVISSIATMWVVACLLPKDVYAVYFGVSAFLAVSIVFTLPFVKCFLKLVKAWPAEEQRSKKWALACIFLFWVGLEGLFCAPLLPWNTGPIILAQSLLSGLVFTLDFLLYDMFRVYSVWVRYNHRYFYKHYKTGLVIVGVIVIIGLGVGVWLSWHKRHGVKAS